jgi:hypothetical protein
MAFKLTQKPTFTAVVKVETPNEKGGFDRSDFKAKFKRVTTDELDELRIKPQREVLREVLAGWDGLVDDADQAVDFTSEHVEALLNIPPALAALAEVFWSNIVKAREKN